MNSNSDNGKSDQLTVVEFPELNTVQSQAARWLAKLDGDQPSREDIAAFRHWINLDPSHREEFEGLIEFWDDLNILTQVITPREVCGQNVSTQKNTQKTSARQRADSRGYSWFGARYVVAGLLVVLLVAAALVFDATWQTPPAMVYATAVGEQKTVALPDRTSVLLNTNSRIEVNYDSGRRGVRLVRGEAHFAVFRDPQRPFEVYAGKGTVRAVGTAFSVHLRSDDVEVVVTEGMVAIGATPDEGGSSHRGSSRVNQVPNAQRNKAKSRPLLTSPVQVAAGNLATFDRESVDSVHLALVEKLEEKLSWRQGMLKFDARSLGEVVDEVSRYTSVKIVIPERQVRELKVGGYFKVGDTESLFEALRDGFGIHAERVSENFVYLVLNDSR